MLAPETSSENFIESVEFFRLKQVVQALQTRQVQELPIKMMMTTTMMMMEKQLTWKSLKKVVFWMKMTRCGIKWDLQLVWISEKSFLIPDFLSMPLGHFRHNTE